MSATTLLATQESAQAAPVGAQGCGYGTGGPNANTICWFDFGGYNQAQATSAAGQDRQVTLPGGYTMTFTLHATLSAQTQNTNASAVPAWAPSLIGNSAYVGIPGSPALHAGGSQGSVTTFSLDDIVVKDSAGATVNGYSLVSADAEATASNESINWRSDTPVSTRALLHPAPASTPENGCQMNITGSGTNSLTCTGSNNTSGPFGSALVESVSPTTFSATLREGNSNGGAEAIILGVMSSNITLNKTVASRVNASDAFTTTATSPERTVIGTGNTGTTNSSTTGTLTVLPRTADQSYTLAEAPTAGTETLLSNYNQAWACTNTATGATTVLPTGSGLSKQLSPEPGDDITCTITNTAKAATLGIVKHAGTPVDVNKDGLTDVGDTIQYTFTVTNTGDLTMSNVGVTDAKVGAVTCPEPTLAPGASQECTADEPYTVTAADLTNGSVDNSATAHGTPPGSTTPKTTTPSTTSTTTTTPAPALTMVKSASPNSESDFVVGQEITYSFLVTNTGNVPLSDITINEGEFTGTGTMSDPTCPEPTLAAGAKVTCTATYTLTQADVDSGSVTNSATAGGTPPENGGTPPTSPPSDVTIPIPDNPAITVAKTASASKATEAGQKITYSFKVTNTGNVTLRNVTVDEGDFSGTGQLSDVVCPEPTLASGVAETCTATYTVTQADIDNGGSITNTATATGTPPGDDTPPVSPPSTSTVPVDQSPSMTVVKSASPTDRASYKVGEVVTYSFVVTNTGNVTITDPTIDDSKFSGTGELSPITCPANSATMAPAAQITCTATYTVTQADVDAGKITNTATVGGTTPDGGNTPPSDPSTVTVPNTAHPSLALVKTSDVAKITTVGQTVTYSFKITNTGDVTQKNVTAKEGKFTGSGKLSEPTCPAAAASLAPGASVTCTATYHVTAADLSSGTLSNTATAAGTDPSGDPTGSVPSTANVKAIAPPAPAGLAFTGTELVGPGIGLALMLLALGGALLVVRRRRSNGDEIDNA
ncbi:DUF7507 domain-containing protein [Curtobacterium sp. L1-20]|uniref:DUF7507 domain-containing protein n=1 Tax=Curtobacterium sp. L1-20 TaxID=3138181 RepID=UPI003B51B8E0